MKLGEAATCSDCFNPGVIVTTTLDGADYDRSLASGGLELEPSAYEPPGVTCRNCEAVRFKSVLPTRGFCGNCGKPNAKAIAHDHGATRSFCDDRCVNEFIAARLSEPRNEWTSPLDEPPHS